MQNLTLTTFNIRCFGFNGDYFAKSKSESRLAYLKKFFENNLNNTDVFILQEIMDLTFLDQILPKGFKFYSYTHDYERHMFVVLACKNEFEFKDIKVIPETTIDTTKSRPAIYGQLLKQGAPLAHIIGVHLKSGYENTHHRITQAQKIIHFIESLDTPLPIIMAGDFNSHIKEKTKKNQSDLFYLEDIFKQKNLVRAEQNEFTYVTNFEKAHLDHFWTDAKVKNVKVYDYTTFSNRPIKDYFDQISDHLPVSVTIEV